MRMRRESEIRIEAAIKPLSNPTARAPRVGTKATSRTVRAAARPEPPTGQLEATCFWKHVSVRVGGCWWWVLVVGVVMPKQHGRHVFPSNTKGPLKFLRGGLLCLVLRTAADGISALQMRDSVLQLRCQVEYHSGVGFHLEARHSGLANTIRDRTFKSAETALPPNKTRSERASNHGPRHSRARNGKRIRIKLEGSTRRRGEGGWRGHTFPLGPLPDGTAARKVLSS